MRALAIGQIYSNLEKAIYQYNIKDICFILDEAVENQVPQLLDIPNEEVLNHMDGKYKMNLWFNTCNAFIYFLSDEAVENQVRPERRNVFGKNKVVLYTPVFITVHLEFINCSKCA